MVLVRIQQNIAATAIVMLSFAKKDEQYQNWVQLILTIFIDASCYLKPDIQWQNV